MQLLWLGCCASVPLRVKRGNYTYIVYDLQKYLSREVARRSAFALTRLVKLQLYNVHCRRHKERIKREEPLMFLTFDSLLVSIYLWSIEIIFEDTTGLGMTQLADRPFFDLPYTFACDFELLPDFFKRMVVIVQQAEAQFDHLTLAQGKLP